MIISQRRLVFESHARRLKRSPFPGQTGRVEDYLERYLNDRNPAKRHPVIAFRHRLLEATVAPTSGDGIRSLEPINGIKAENARAIAVARINSSNFSLTRKAIRMAILPFSFFMARGISTEDKESALLAIGIAAGAIVAAFFTQMHFSRKLRQSWEDMKLIELLLERDEERVDADLRATRLLVSHLANRRHGGWRNLRQRFKGFRGLDT